MPDPNAPPGQRQGGKPESTQVILRRDGQDDGPDGTDEFPTPRAWLWIILEHDQPPIETGQSAGEFQGSKGESRERQ